MRSLGLVLLLAAAAAGQNIVSVQNAASLGAGLPSAAIAPGSLVSIRIVRGGPLVINPDLSKISVKLQRTDDPRQYDARVLQSSFGVTLALIPEDIPLGAAELLYLQDGQAGPPVALTITASAFGVFTQSGNGIGPALVQNGPGFALNKLLNPALPGDVVTLWGTGLGEASAESVSVEAGGLPASITYAGKAPGFPGLDQINFRLPLETPSGCYVSLLVKSRDAISNEATLAVAQQPGACPHPFGLSETELKQLDAGGKILLGVASMRSQAAPVIGPPQISYERNQAASVELLRRDVFEIEMLAQPLLAEDRYYGCARHNSFAIPRLIAVDNTDAGPALMLSGSGKSLEVPKGGVPILYLNVLPASAATPSLDTLPDPFFTPGTWLLNGTGGATIAPFQAELRMPPPIRWTGRDKLATLDRNQDQLITWQADGYSDDDMLTVTLNSVNSQLVCRAPASSGQLVIPNTLLQQIPESFAVQGVPMGTLELRLTPRPERRKLFDLPRVGGGTDRGLFDYLLSETLRVAIR